MIDALWMAGFAGKRDSLRDVYPDGTINATVAMSKRVVVAWHRLGPYHHARLRAVKQLEVVGIEMAPVDLTNRWAPVDDAQGFRKLVAFDTEDPDRVPSTLLVA